MDKMKKFVKSPTMLILLFVVAAALIIGGSIGGARAVLINSEYYQSQINLYEIGVQLNDGSGELLTKYSTEAPEDFKFIVGKYYDEPINVTNEGMIDEYVRVIIYRYWESKNENGEIVKDVTLDPNKINLVFTTDENWIFDEKYSTTERLVYYYKYPIMSEQKTSDLMTKFCIDSSVAMYQEYNGATIRLYAETDGVQTHNAEHAIASAWGRPVSIADDGTLSLED